MTNDQLNKIIDDTFGEIQRLRATKGKDYTRGEADTLSNFKRIAKSLDLEPEQVWAVYAGKHWDAIVTYCKDGEVTSEPIEGRIDDMLTYLLLLKGLVQERIEGNEVTLDSLVRGVIPVRRVTPPRIDNADCKPK